MNWTSLKFDALAILESPTVIPLTKPQFDMIEAGRSKDDSRPTLGMVEISNHGAVVTDGFKLIVIAGIDAPDGVYQVDPIGRRLWIDKEQPRFPDWMAITKGKRCDEPSSIVEYGTVGSTDTVRMSKGTIVNKEYLVKLHCYDGDEGKIYESAEGVKRPLHFEGDWKGVEYWGRLMPMFQIRAASVRLNELNIGDKFTRGGMPFVYEVVTSEDYAVSYKLLNSDDLIVASEDGIGSEDWNLMVTPNVMG